MHVLKHSLLFGILLRTSLTKFIYGKSELPDQHDTSVGQGKILTPRKESNPWPPKHRAGALSTELREPLASCIQLR